MLKVALYSSLNGGNSVSDTRILDNVSKACSHLLPPTVTTNEVMQSEIFKFTQQVVTEFPLVKKFLGRDSMGAEKKHENYFETIHPRCQVLIISNFPPQNYHKIAKDQAIIDKLIVVEYPAESKIPADLQVPVIGNQTTDLIPDILNWALSTPPATIRKHIYALEYNTYKAQRTDPSATMYGLPSFLQKRFWPSSGGFTEINKIRNVLDQYVEQTGDDSVVFLKKERVNSYLGKAIETTVADVFEVTVQYSRRTSTTGTRPYGLTNLIIKTDIEAKPSVGAMPLSPKTYQGTIKLEDPFAAVHEVDWLETDKVSFYKTALLEFRRLQLENPQPSDTVGENPVKELPGETNPSDTLQSEGTQINLGKDIKELFDD